MELVLKIAVGVALGEGVFAVTATVIAGAFNRASHKKKQAFMAELQARVQAYQEQRQGEVPEASDEPRVADFLI